MAAYFSSDDVLRVLGIRQVIYNIALATYLEFCYVILYLRISTVWFLRIILVVDVGGTKYHINLC